MRCESADLPTTQGIRDRSVAAMTTTLHRIQDERLAGVLSLLLVMAATAVANFAGSGENGGPAEYAVGVAVCALLAALLFGRVLPSTADPARAAWIVAVLGVVTLAAFWSGLPIVLGMGAVYAGSRAGRKAPVAIGALTIVAAVVACVIG
jgi:hypothetical protein